MYTLTLIVSANTSNDEIVGVVGNVAELGEWNYKQGTLLTLDESSKKWMTKVVIPKPLSVCYRYFVGSYADKDEGKFIVRKWEASMKCRRCVEVNQNLQVEEEFGIIHGVNVLDNGWLCGQTEIRFNISDPGDEPVMKWMKSVTDEEYLIDFIVNENLPTQTKVMKPYEFAPISDRTVEVPKGTQTFVTFVAETMDLDSFSARFNILKQDNKVLFAYALVVGDMLKDSIGTLRLVLMDSGGAAVGRLKIEYVVIKTYKCDQSMEDSYSMHWTERPTLNIGHRGLGNSFTAAEVSDVYENTISSFKMAESHGADMIEFDIQLSKDKTPIVFHDFTLCTTVNAKRGQGSLLHEVEVQTLTYTELKRFHTRHRSMKSNSKELKFSEDDHRDHFTPCPTLAEVFQEVSEAVGFDLELKWPHYYLDKEWEHGVDTFFDANEYLDLILDVVFKYSGKRRIVFSCFEANICAMLRRKQNKYPVFFLTNGDTGHYKAFMDLRARFNSMAVAFAKSEGFLGIVTLEKDAYADEELVNRVHDAGLRLLLYGDDIVKPQNKEKLIKQGMDGLIFDRLHHSLPEGKNVYQRGIARTSN